VKKVLVKNPIKSIEDIAKYKFYKSSFMPEKCLTKNFQINILKNMIKKSYSFLIVKKSAIEQIDKGGDII